MIMFIAANAKQYPERILGKGFGFIGNFNKDVLLRENHAARRRAAVVPKATFRKEGT